MKRFLLFTLCLGLLQIAFAQGVQGGTQEIREQKGSGTETPAKGQPEEIPVTYSLEDFRAMALQANKGVLIAQENIKAATDLKKAAFAQFLPNFSANGTYMWNQKNISLLGEDALLPVGTKMADGSFGFRAEQINNQWTMVSGNPVPLDANGQPFDPKVNPDKILWKDYAYLPKEAMEFDIQNIFAGGIGFVQPIFMGNKIRELYRIAKSGEQLAHIQHDQKLKSLTIEVDEAYWRTVSLLNKKKLALEYKALLEKLLSNVEAMNEEGVATKGDLLNVKVKLNEANLALTKVENGISLSKMALFQLCGLDINGNYSLQDEGIEQKAIVNPAYDIEKILSLRPEIQSLEQMNNIAKSNVNIMASRFMPNLAVSANYIFSNPSSYNGYSTKFAGMFNVGVVLNVPIFHFGDKIHTLRAAKRHKKIAEYQLEEAKEMIELQVSQSNFRIIEANKKLEAAVSNIEAAQENLKLANEAYKEGLISIADLMGAQTAWVSANSERIDAGIDVRLCELYLQRAKGEIEIPQAENNDNKEKNPISK